MALARLRGYRSRPLDSSIGLEIVLVIDAQRGVLMFLAGDAVAGDKEVDVGAHEAAEGVLRGADNRLAPDVEAGVYQHRAAGPRLERREQPLIPRVGVLVHGLHARPHVDMADRRHLGTHGLPPSDPTNLLSSPRHR